MPPKVLKQHGGNLLADIGQLAIPFGILLAHQSAREMMAETKPATNTKPRQAKPATKPAKAAKATPKAQRVQRGGGGCGCGGVVAAFS
jgi:hypothetical protein